KRIYLDYASAPPVLKEAEEAVHDARLYTGNPGAIHAEGVAAKRALDDARDRIASLLGVKGREIIFTGGLTEANNIAILGSAR
ncbi:aminotransferase class V-fold PLP-dependent enzyme, partial [Escherichia coli]|nr:aminotransferase class V-fold PLP-dependent enzyme [Escherichia coli]